MIFLLTVKDIFLNLVTFGWWGRSQGDKSSGATVLPRDGYPIDFEPRGPRHPKGRGVDYDRIKR